MSVTDVSGYWGMKAVQGLSAVQSVQPGQAVDRVKGAVGVSMLKKAMEANETSMTDILGSLPDAGRKAAELSVNPHIGSMFDMSV